MSLFTEAAHWDLEEFPLDDIESIETYLHRVKNLPEVNLFFDLENLNIEGLIAGFGLKTLAIPLTDKEANKLLYFFVPGCKQPDYYKLISGMIEDDEEDESVLGIWDLNPEDHVNPFDVEAVAEEIFEVRSKIKNHEYELTLIPDTYTDKNTIKVSSYSYKLRLL